MAPASNAVVQACVQAPVMSLPDLRFLLAEEEEAYFRSKQAQFDASAPDTPGMLQLLAAEEESYFSSKRLTTVMVRNIPSRFSEKLIMQHLQDIGCGDAYDFFLPTFHGGRANRGFFFLNLKDSGMVEKLQEKLAAHPFKGSKKTVEVSWAELQGVDELREKLATKAERRGASQPIFLEACTAQ